MKYKYNDEWVDLSIKALDSMPVGTQVEYTGETIPTGWEEVNDYSTTEIDTGKKWIDGKPIYRKVIEGTINSTGSYQTILTDSTIDTLTDIGGNIKDSGNSIQYIIGKSTYRDGTNTSRIIKVSSNIRLDYSDQFHSLPFKAIIEYTKTTD